MSTATKRSSLSPRNQQALFGAPLVAYVERELAGPHLLSNDVTIFAAPPYNPGKWNDDPYILSNNNCDNYACDRIINSRAEPGVSSGAKFQCLVCGDVGAASVLNGLAAVAGPNGNPPPNSHFAALSSGA
ncbi:hypothetical protein VSR69_42245 [Paraburkholderia phytofirmans]